MNYSIKKSSGEHEPFNIEKLKCSLRKSGAHEDEISFILKQIKTKKPKTTQDLHELVMQLLAQKDRPTADRYNLKRGIMELGPAGHAFETFIGALFRAQGYNVQTRVVISGACVDHEVDGIAQKNGKQFMIETKFHNRTGIKSDVKVTLYVQARFEDICANSHNKNYDQAWLVTNTQFTSEAIKYGVCKNMRLLGWNYPEQESLAYFVDTHKLYPITTLCSLSDKKKQQLLSDGLVLCKDIEANQNLLKKMGLSDQKIKRIIQESKELCS